MAFSYKKTVISPLIGTLKDIDEEFYYSYIYKDEKSHIYELYKQMDRVYNDSLKSDIIRIKGLDSREYVKNNYSWEYISSYLNKAYGHC